MLAGISARHGISVPDPAPARTGRRRLGEGRRRGVTESPHFFVGSDSCFGPTLENERHGEHLRIAIDDAELA